MQPGGIHHAELILLFLLFMVGGLTTLSRRFETPYPIVLVVGGLLLSFIPNLPQISLNPNVVFLVMLPPLLFAAAFNTSWHDFRFHLVSVLLLAFGLVGFTVLGVAVASEYLLPGFDWRLGLALGAVVCSTDAIAATSIAARVGLPRYIVDVLEGESLVNDASSLLALEFAASLVVSGQKPGFSDGLERMLILVGGALLVGFVAAWLIHRLQLRIADPPIEITVSLMAPYVSYLLAESIHVSGPLATVVCGLYSGAQELGGLQYAGTAGECRGVEHPGLPAQRDRLHPDRATASLHPRRNSRDQSPRLVVRRGHTDGGRDRAADLMDVPGGVASVLHPHTAAEAELWSSYGAGSVCARLDGHARRVGTGGGRLAAAFA